jgi:hypothetical protein
VRGNMVTEEIYQLNSMLIEGVLPEKQEEEEEEAVQGNTTQTESTKKKH